MCKGIEFEDLNLVEGVEDTELEKQMEEYYEEPIGCDPHEWDDYFQKWQNKKAK